MTLGIRRIRENGDRVVLDDAGAIQTEYNRRSNASGGLGAGDGFYRYVLENRLRCERVSLPRRADGEYADLPQVLIDTDFDRDDRKFAALAKRAGISVATAVDSDWIDAQAALAAGGICVHFVCGRDRALWFAN